MGDRKPVVMIAEDHEDLLWLYQRWVKQAGCHVREARDGAWLLAQVLPDPPDLILLSLQLPTVNGLDVCRKLKTSDEHSSIPVIAMTTYVDELASQHLKLLGVDTLLLKPFSRTELVAHIDRILGPREQEEDEEIRELERKVWTRIGG